MQQIVDRLRQHGYKMTPQRREIIRVLLDSEEHLKAKDVYARVKPIFPEISLDTVYRTLRMLVIAGIACQTNLRTPESSEFAIEGSDHHHHLVCVQCGKTFQLHDCPVTRFLQHIEQHYSFRVESHALEVYGRCASCSSHESP